jgi:hypothetical protein
MIPSFGGLGALPFQAGVVTRQITPENPTGGKGAAAPWEPDPSDPFPREIATPPPFV